jgi:hypothetical protein
MEFQEKTITIKNNNNDPVEIPAWQGVGTGLAYHHPIDEHNQATRKGYAITVISLQSALTKHVMPTEPEVQTWLEKCADLDKDRWIDIDWPTFKKRYCLTERKRSKILAQVEYAHEFSLIPRDEIFIYALDADGDLIEGADHDVETDNPEDEQTKKLVEGCFKAYSQAAEIVLTHMDAKTGNHKLIHTYERPAPTEAQKEDPIYPDFESAQEALDRGERVRITMEPFEIDPQLIQKALDLQSQDRLEEWKRTQS